ncbi:hypothetical protein E2C01_000358 [Portunus trituberculatus]|uniref:Uncharacterized protein n=1 Tax=Portunus trituberculatus TaxID=210409 RepID=A0A5B7CF06_PORTR|nr:hypothetical protein [Portunus trituberculatus]
MTPDTATITPSQSHNANNHYRHDRHHCQHDHQLSLSGRKHSPSPHFYPIIRLFFLIITVTTVTNVITSASIAAQRRCNASRASFQSEGVTALTPRWPETYRQHLMVHYQEGASVPHLLWGPRGSKRTGSNPVHGPSVGWASSLEHNDRRTKIKVCTGILFSSFYFSLQEAKWRTGDGEGGRDCLVSLRSLRVISFQIIAIAVHGRTSLSQARGNDCMTLLRSHSWRSLTHKLPVSWAPNTGRRERLETLA